MKMKTKKLLFILILVVSIMAIVITASQIYNIIENNKIIDNQIDGTEGEEGDYYEQTDSSIYSEQVDNFQATNPWGLDYFSNTWVETDSTTRNRPGFRVWFSGVMRTIGLNSKIKPDTINVSAKIKTDWDTSGSPADKTSTSVINQEIEDLVFQDIPNYTNIDLSTIMNYANDQFAITAIKYNYYYSSNGINITEEFVTQVQYVAEKQTKNSDGSWGNSEYNYSDDMYIHVQEFSFDVRCTTYNIENENFSYGGNKKFQINSNELLLNDTLINNKKISEYNYEQITKSWLNGKETATLQCSIGEYYDEDGNLAISTQNNDLPMLFNIRDVVIPYIPVAGGGTEPMSKKKDGSPKKFQVTQIRPYFDGAFWQEIQLQETNVGYTIKQLDFTSGTDGNILIGYAAPDQTIIVTEGKIINAFISWKAGDLNILRPNPTITINSDNNSFTVSGVYLSLANKTATGTAEIIYEV